MNILDSALGRFLRIDPVSRMVRNVDWCHGDSLGNVSIVSNGAHSTVTVQCTECREGRWTAVYKVCGQCSSSRHSTSSVRTREDGYRVTFTCLECGTHDVRLQSEDF